MTSDAATPSNEIRWQYTVVDIGSFRAAERMVTAFGHLGERRWELVGIYDKQSNWIAMEKGFVLFTRVVPPGQVPDGPWATSLYANEFLQPGAPGTSDPGWFPDPHGRYELRWWDGQSWTATVNKDGKTRKDPRGR